MRPPSPAAARDAPMQHMRTPSAPSASSASPPAPHAPAGAHSCPGPSTVPCSYERHAAELARAMPVFLAPFLATEAEYRRNEAMQQFLRERVREVHPRAQLLAFGSMANGFALRHSDMDLCCVVPLDDDARSPAELVEALSERLRGTTPFQLLPLPKARIPILKITQPCSAAHPYALACDVGFNNHVALENTRLLLSYAMLDPPRVRTLVLLVKVWTKRRKLNAPFTGTLSSYGYTLLVLFFLVHVQRPAVLPNLQRIAAERPLERDEVMLEGHNVYFYDDMDALRRTWHSANRDHVGELLLRFFRYFARDFQYAKDVVSLSSEGGLLTKDGAWAADVFGIEDPFQRGYNVARTVTKDGLYTIRGEFMRASRLLANRSVPAAQLLDELCAEREDSLTRAPDAPRHDTRARSVGRAGGWGAPADAARPAAPYSGSFPPQALLAPWGTPVRAPPPPRSQASSPTSDTARRDAEPDEVFGMSPELRPAQPSCQVAP